MEETKKEFTPRPRSVPSARSAAVAAARFALSVLIKSSTLTTRMLPACASICPSAARSCPRRMTGTCAHHRAPAD